MLTPGNSTLVIVDLQERFAPAIGGWEGIVERASILARTASLLGWTVVVTEQYPQGLGPTVPQVAEALEGFDPLEKTSFPATGAGGFDLQGRPNAVLCGVETHVCVQQTALALAGQGVAVQVVADATGSRMPADRDAAMARMALAGIAPTTTEAVGFELLGSADADGFREFQGMIK
ncbi:MAG: isochorismatase family protein [Solirubrobacterales bacterium]